RPGPPLRGALTVAIPGVPGPRPFPPAPRSVLPRLPAVPRSLPGRALAAARPPRTGPPSAAASAPGVVRPPPYSPPGRHTPAHTVPGPAPFPPAPAVPVPAVSCGGSTRPTGWCTGGTILDSDPVPCATARLPAAGVPASSGAAPRGSLAVRAAV